MNNSQKAQSIVANNNYLNLATITKEGHPWNSPVVYVYDKKLNFYWFSWKENQHSKNIRDHHQVFATIYDSQQPLGTGQGLYLQGQAKELTNPVEMLIGVTLMYKKLRKEKRDVKEFLHGYPRRVYRFTPEKVWINEDGDIKGNFIDIRVEVELEELRKII